MAKSSIFIIPDASKVDTGKSQAISFDAVTSFTPSKSRTITKSPISTDNNGIAGGFVSEILSEKGGRISIEAYVANNPIILDQDNLISTKDAETRSQAAYLALTKLYDSRDTVTIQYRFDKNLNSYLLTHFEPMLMPSDTIGFRLEFEEVRFADEKRVQLVLNMSPPLTEAANGKTNAGGSKTPASPKESTLVEKWYDDTKGAFAGETTTGVTP